MFLLFVTDTGSFGTRPPRDDGNSPQLVARAHIPGIQRKVVKRNTLRRSPGCSGFPRRATSGLSTSLPARQLALPRVNSGCFDVAVAKFYPSSHGQQPRRRNQGCPVMRAAKPAWRNRHARRPCKPCQGGIGTSGYRESSERILLAEQQPIRAIRACSMPTRACRPR